MKLIFTAIVFPILFLPVLLNAQITSASQWTWVNGNNTANAPGIYGTQGTPAAANKPGARGGNSACWKDAAGNFWLFGGYDPSNAWLNDLWKYNTATNEWTWIKGSATINQFGSYGTKGMPAAGNTPGARYESATWTDAEGNFWLFGGYGYAGSLGSGITYINLNDLWKYNPAANEWTWVNGADTNNVQGVYGTQGTPGAANTPGARYSSAAWTDAAGNFWLFGGTSYSAGGSSYFNDLWKYNPSANEWTWVNGSSTANQQGVYGTQGTAAAANRPGARDESVTWTDAGGNLWLFGGTSYTALDDFLNDLWKYNPGTNEWTWVNGANTVNQTGVYGTRGTAAAANRPGARGVNRSSWTDAAGNFWFMGGYGYAANSFIDGYLNDLWQYNAAANQWTWINGANAVSQAGSYGTLGTPSAANQPGARSTSASWIDGTGNFWLFGGANGAGTGFLNDLWKLSPANVLPVTLSSVKAYQQNADIAVEWKVENESGIKQYDVEKSTNGTTYIKAGRQAARSNNAGTVKYNWLDVNAATGNNFYRVRSTSISGETKYSQVVKVTLGKGKPGYEVYPNPVTGNAMQLQFINQAKGTYTVQLLNALGQIMMTGQIAHEAGSSTETLRLSNHTKGSYTLVITSPDKSRQSIKIIY